MSSWLEPDSKRRRILVGFGIYAACAIVFAILAGDRLQTHTAANHYALLADSWINGRHHLLGTPPSYTGMNDFALYDGKWFISFPPFPAILMLPLVWASGSPENFRDGQFVVWLAGIGPAVLFLVLEKMRRTQRSERSEVDNVRLALLFAFGTVYFFTSVQGTVWFAALVVGVGLAALFVLFALDAERPILAGAMIGFMFMTRPTTALAGVLFVLEAVRVAYGKPLPAEGTLEDRIETVWRELDRKKLARTLFRFAIPIALVLLFCSWLNSTRFHNPSPAAFGHEYLQIGWKTRIDRWGLLSTHFLSRNLTAMLTSLPWRRPPGAHGMPLFTISGHGLAVWFVTPFYLFLVRPRKTSFLWGAAALAALGPLACDLLYQSTGFFQFSYRYANDYAVFLFVMLATSGPLRFGRAFWACAAWAIGWNLFGAMSFERERFGAYYSHEAAVPMRKWNGNATLDLVYPPD